MFGLIGGAQWLLDLTLVALLVATLLHALRLKRALGVLRRDKPAFEQLVSSLQTSTDEAQAGIEALKAAADGAGRTIEQQVRSSLALKEDLRAMTERGEQLAERLERLVRAAQEIAPSPTRGWRHRSADLDIAALDTPGLDTPRLDSPGCDAPDFDAAERPAGRVPASSRVRSQAERDLLAALRVAR